MAGFASVAGFASTTGFCSTAGIASKTGVASTAGFFYFAALGFSSSKAVGFGFAVLCLSMKSLH
jgi:hypothetical protein